jgi:hypothetical protein
MPTFISSILAGSSGISVSDNNGPEITINNTGVVACKGLIGNVGFTSPAGTLAVGTSANNITFDLANTVVNSASGLSGAVGFTSPLNTLNIGTSANNITFDVVSSGGLAPITDYVFSTFIANISPAGGISNNLVNTFLVPTTGIYMLEYTMNFGTTATGMSPYTQVSFNPVAREFCQLNMVNSGTGLNADPGAYCAYLTTLPATNVYFQSQIFTSIAKFTAGTTLYFQSIVNNAGSCTWGVYNANVSIIKLC